MNDNVIHLKKLMIRDFNVWRKTFDASVWISPIPENTDNRVYTGKLLATLAKSPVFVVEKTEAERKCNAESFFDDLLNLLPFDSLFFYDIRHPDMLMHLTKLGDSLLSVVTQVGKGIVVTNIYLWGRVASGFFLGFKGIINGNLASIKDLPQGWEESVKSEAVHDLCCIHGALFSMEDLGQHIVRVAPCNSSKSVDWKEARTRYVILSQCSISESFSNPGATFSQENITRSAHARRAHSKTLRHGRYKNMQGKTIRVRSSWVGPTECKDHRNNVIYKYIPRAGDKPPQ